MKISQKTLKEYKKAMKNDESLPSIDIFKSIYKSVANSKKIKSIIENSGAEPDDVRIQQLIKANTINRIRRSANEEREKVKLFVLKKTWIDSKKIGYVEGIIKDESIKMIWANESSQKEIIESFETFKFYEVELATFVNRQNVKNYSLSYASNPTEIDEEIDMEKYFKGMGKSGEFDKISEMSVDEIKGQRELDTRVFNVFVEDRRVFNTDYGLFGSLTITDIENYGKFEEHATMRISINDTKYISKIGEGSQIFVKGQLYINKIPATTDDDGNVVREEREELSIQYPTIGFKGDESIFPPSDAIDEEPDELQETEVIDASKEYSDDDVESYSGEEKEESEEKPKKSGKPSLKKLKGQKTKDKDEVKKLKKEAEENFGCTEFGIGYTEEGEDAEICEMCDYNEKCKEYTK